jgi:hypothetical protein
MDSSIHAHIIAAKIQDDMRAAGAARQAKAVARENRREAKAKTARRRFFRRAPTTTVGAR